MFQEYYTVHGEVALLVAEEYYRTRSVVKYLGVGGTEAGLPSVCLSSQVSTSGPTN